MKLSFLSILFVFCSLFYQSSLAQDWQTIDSIYELIDNDNIEKANALLSQNKNSLSQTEYGLATYNCLQSFLLNTIGKEDGDVTTFIDNAFGYFSSIKNENIVQEHAQVDVKIRMACYSLYAIYHPHDSKVIEALSLGLDLYQKTHILDKEFFPLMTFCNYPYCPITLKANVEKEIDGIIHQLSNGDHFEWGNYYFFNAFGYFHNNSWEMGKQSLETAIQHYEQVSNYETEGSYFNALTYYALTLVNLGNFELGNKQIDKIINILSPNNNIRLVLVETVKVYADQLYMLLANNYALTYYQKAKSLCNEMCGQDIISEIDERINQMNYLTGINDSPRKGHQSTQDLLVQALNYYHNQNYNTAISIFQEVINELRPNLNNADTSYIYAESCNNIAHCYYQLQRFEDCERTLIEGIDAIKKVDENSPVYRKLISDLAEYYLTTNNYQNAFELLFEAKILYEKNRDLNYQYYQTLFKIANLAFQFKDFLHAFIFLRRCEDYFFSMPDDIQSKNLDIIKIMQSLASVEARLNIRQDAITHISACLDMCSNNDLYKDFLPSLYQTKAEITMVDLFYNHQGMTEECLNDLRRAYELNNEGFYLEDEIAVAEYLMGNDDNVHNLSIDISKKIINNTLTSLSYMSTAERENIWNNNNQYLQQANYFLLHCNSNAESVGATYDNVLFSKGLLLRTSNFIGDEIMRSKDNQAKMQYQQVQNLYSQLLDTDLPGDSARAIRSKITTLEKQLSSKFVTASSLEDKLVTSWKDVRSSLGKNEVAIEFAVIPEYKRDLNFMLDSVPTNYYYAFINSKKLNSPIAIRLCEESQIKELMDMDAGLTTENRMRNRYTNNDIQYFHGRRLYELIWQPIDSVLEENSTIYFSPAGLLNSIAMVAINDGERCLIEKYDMHQVSTTAQVAAVKKYKRKAPQSARIYGGIVYDVPREQMIAEARRTTIENKTIEQFASPVDLLAQSNTERGGSVWGYLPHSLEEAQAVYSYLKESGMKLDNLQYLDSIHATEESFKAMSYHSPDVIQISTHGFFASDSKTITETHFLQQYQKSVFGNMSEPQVSPMMRSGVIMAGGNGAWTGKQIVEGIEDGILTAEEVSRLNLSGTELVTLSACQSGLGEVSSAEGVFGLQRGFKMAGVKTLIVSLWKVNDATANEFMQQFYTRWLAGDSKAEAFKKAQMAIKEKHPNPYFWAPFIMID